MAPQKRPFLQRGPLRLSNNPFGEVWRTRRSSKVNSYRPAFPGRSIFAEGADRAHRSFRSPPSGRFAAFGGNSPQGWRFPPVPGGRGVCAPGRKHFLSFWRKRPPQADFFDKLNTPAWNRFPPGRLLMFPLPPPWESGRRAGFARIRSFRKSPPRRAWPRSTAAWARERGPGPSAPGPRPAAGRREAPAAP